MISHFSTKTIEMIGFYVYLLIDPRTNKIFYIGKGCGNRVFEHLQCAIETNAKNEKLSTIRDILNNGLNVKYYIVRSNLTQETAYEIESTLIDLFTYSDFEHLAAISNIVSGHDQYSKGIKTVNEIEQLYCGEHIDIDNLKHNLLLINLNQTYTEAIERSIPLYEATCQSWCLGAKQKLKPIDFVLCEYKGVVRAVFTFERWVDSTIVSGRYKFIGKDVKDSTILSLYQNRQTPIRKKGHISPLRFFNPTYK